ncbi:hypothetical protein SRABI27_03931 [Pedobacter sp. Bi27]|uniref:hypothetical protein n=1 Tax=unclassified Pedobacter TaxID=2628915 RepID=UPI001D4D2752|nr:MULTISPECIES: hypothetical protein [unclassified Pedobacter]CAH0123434.1 hypothetical protein SRABI36_00002 [Pedobacter sp. Bi36]CAH0174481.1 hypothetical protein SRABI126_01100 [Pedobacter sp. Bi126]CAH0286205.1 hypothetical protein SRABI27_03931 [Pedobacter sp. Bi27]
MKKNIFYVVLSFFSVFVSDAFSQKITNKTIIGVWQVSTPKTGSALLANYNFFSNGKFIYKFDGYDDRTRILSVEGTYKLLGNRLYLYIQSRTEIIGGSLVQGAMGFQKEELVLEGGKSIKVPQTSKEPVEITIEKCKASGAIECMKLQNNTYYRVSKVPE